MSKQEHNFDSKYEYILSGLATLTAVEEILTTLNIFTRQESNIQSTGEANFKIRNIEEFISLFPVVPGKDETVECLRVYRDLLETQDSDLVTICCDNDPKLTKKSKAAVRQHYGRFCSRESVTHLLKNYQPLRTVRYNILRIGQEFWGHYLGNVMGIVVYKAYEIDLLNPYFDGTRRPLPEELSPTIQIKDYLVELTVRGNGDHASKKRAIKLGRELLKDHVHLFPFDYNHDFSFRTAETSLTIS